MCIQPLKQAFLVIYTKESSAALCMVVELSFMLFYFYFHMWFLCVFLLNGNLGGALLCTLDAAQFTGPVL